MEPRALVFKDDASSASNVTEASGTRKEPGALVFPTEARKEVHPMTTLSTRDTGPGALAFPDANSPKSAASSTRPRAESTPTRPDPGALRFPDSPSTTTKPTAKQPSPPVPAPARPAGPAALQFPTAPPSVVVAEPRRLGQATDHPSQSEAEQEVARIAGELYPEHKERLFRQVRDLLPLAQAKVENWAAKPLEDYREYSAKADSLVRRFDVLNASKTLNTIVESMVPKTGLIDRLKSKFELSVEQKEANVKYIKTELETVLAETRAVRPDLEDASVRLLCHLVALRAVTTVVKVREDGFSRTIDRRLELLRNSTTLMHSGRSKLKATEDTIVRVMSQCDTLLNVTFPAVRQAGLR